jgi:hypothetical protein
MPACRATAVADVGDDETAISHRDALVEFVAVANWTDPAEDRARISAARRYAGTVEPFASGIYVNDLADEGEAGIRRAYGPGQAGQVTALEARYDPDNVFHLNTTSVFAGAATVIARIWRGWTTPENAEAYQRIVGLEVLPGIAARDLDGYHGAYLLRRDLDGEVEFATIMLFDSLEQVLPLCPRGNHSSCA